MFDRFKLVVLEKMPKLVSSLLVLFRCSRFHSALSCVGRALDLAHDVVPLAEEGEPLAQHRLRLVRQIVPVWSAVLGLQRRLRQRAGRIFACEYCIAG